MASVIDFLEAFNRKERFFLVSTALGNPAFTLSPDFRAQIAGRLDISVPEHAFVAMDFHLTWLYASVFLAAKGVTLEAAWTQPRPVFDNGAGIIRGNQEDLDLVVAYEEKQSTQIVLIEAKAFTGWSKKPLESKALRLREIFGADGDGRLGVIPHFLIASPRPPQKLRLDKWPVWMAPEDSCLGLN